MQLTNKKITIVGAHRSGIGAAKLVKRSGGIPFVTDFAADERAKRSAEILRSENIEVEIGSHSDRAYECDLMVISPGVPSDAAVIKEAREKDIKIISEIELAYSVCKGTIVAITGTNGKTTTTALLGHIINSAGYKAYTAGNIGHAFSEVALDANRDDYVSLEVSSFQLDHIDDFKPEIAMLLNITPDHLNRYENDLSKYVASKHRIFMNQSSSDLLILNKDCKLTAEYKIEAESRIKYFSLYEKLSSGIYLDNDEIIYKESGSAIFRCKLSDISLKGEHNYANAMACILAAKWLNINDEEIVKALGTFPGVEHRLEFVRDLEGVEFINDSKATNVESVWYALRSFSKPINLILGGIDKGNDYDRIKDLVIDNVKKIYAIGESRDKIKLYFEELVPVEEKNTLEECVAVAAGEAEKGDVVLLSPACASFDMFDSYEHRGKVFKEAVNKL